MAYDIQNIAWRICAEIGLLVIPRGLNSHSTTEWLDCGLDGGAPQEPIPWLQPDGYSVTSLGIAFWCDEQSIWRNHLLLRRLYQALVTHRVREGIRLPNPAVIDARIWLRDEFERHNIGPRLSFSLVELLLILDWLAATLDIAQCGDSQRSYLSEYIEYGFYFLRVTRVG